jgi:hypothetical protein
VPSIPLVGLAVMVPFVNEPIVTVYVSVPSSEPVPGQPIKENPNTNVTKSSTKNDFILYK